MKRFEKIFWLLLLAMFLGMGIKAFAMADAAYLSLSTVAEANGKCPGDQFKFTVQFCNTNVYSEQPVELYVWMQETSLATGTDSAALGTPGQWLLLGNGGAQNPPMQGGSWGSAPYGGGYTFSFSTPWQCVEQTFTLTLPSNMKYGTNYRLRLQFGENYIGENAGDPPVDIPFTSALPGTCSNKANLFKAVEGTATNGAYMIYKLDYNFFNSTTNTLQDVIPNPGGCLSVVQASPNPKDGSTATISGTTVTWTVADANASSVSPYVQTGEVWVEVALSGCACGTALNNTGSFSWAGSGGWQGSNTVNQTTCSLANVVLTKTQLDGAGKPVTTIQNGETVQYVLQYDLSGSILKCFESFQELSGSYSGTAPSGWLPDPKGGGTWQILTDPITGEHYIQYTDTADYKIMNYDVSKCGSTGSNGFCGAGNMEQVDVRIDGNASNGDVGMVFRDNGANPSGGYWLIMSIDPNPANLSIQVNDSSGNPSWPAACKYNAPTGLGPVRGVWYTIKMMEQPVGTFYAKYWPRGTPEPTGWQITCSDGTWPCAGYTWYPGLAGQQDYMSYQNFKLFTANSLSGASVTDGVPVGVDFQTASGTTSSTPAVGADSGNIVWDFNGSDNGAIGGTLYEGTGSFTWTGIGNCLQALTAVNSATITSTTPANTSKSNTVTLAINCTTPTFTITETSTRTVSPTISTTPTFTDTPTNTRTPTPTITAATPSFTVTPSYTRTITPSDTATPSSTITPSRTPTSTQTVTPSPSPTSTDTPTQTDTSTRTVTPSPSPTSTDTSTQTVTSTRTVTPSPSPTLTSTSTATATPTQTMTSTDTSTRTATPTSTNTTMNTSTDTSTSTPTDTVTSTRTATLTATPTYSVTATPTSTITTLNTSTDTSTVTPTPTRTATSSSTATATATSTVTFSSTQTMTSTATATRTATATVTPTATVTYTQSPGPSATDTDTPTDTSTVTPSSTQTVTSTNTDTRTVTPTVTPTPTQTSTQSPGPSATDTDTPTSTSTDTPTYTQTMTRTDTPSVTGTPTSTSTQSPGPTATDTDTPTDTSTITATPTQTDTRTQTVTITDTSTVTSTPTSTSTQSPGPSATDTSTRTDTSTVTATATVTATRSATATATATATASDTATDTPVNTATDTSTRTATPTATPSATASPTRSDTATRTATRTATSTRTPSATVTVSPTITLTPVPMPYTIVLAVYNSAGELVKTIYAGPIQMLPTSFNPSPTVINGADSTVVTFAGMLPNGSHTLSWDGTNSQGQLVSDGDYSLQLQMRDPVGNVTTMTTQIMVLQAGGQNSLRIYNSAGEQVGTIDLTRLPADLVGFSLPNGPQAVLAFDASGNALPGTGLGMDFVEASGGTVFYHWNGLGMNGQPLQSGVYTLQLVKTNGNGEVVISTQVVTVLRNGSPASSTAAHLAPNPATGSQVSVLYKVSAIAFARADVYNLAGEKVATGMDSAKIGVINLNISNLSGGVYLVRFVQTSDGAILVSKTLKLAILR